MLASESLSVPSHLHPGDQLSDFSFSLLEMKAYNISSISFAVLPIYVFALCPIPPYALSTLVDMMFSSWPDLHGQAEIT